MNTFVQLLFDHDTALLTSYSTDGRGGGTKDDLCPLLISIIPTLVYMLFDAVIPTSLNIYCNLFYTCINAFFLSFYIHVGHFQNMRYRRFVTEETANILILVCW